MVGFAQQLQSEVTPIAAPAAPSSMSGIFSAISAFKPKEVKEPSLEDNKKQAGLLFYDQLEAARQAKEQGNNNAATSIATSAYRQYYSQYGASDENINTSFQNFTGVPVGVGLGEGAVDMSSVFSSEEYTVEAGILQAANPNLSQADIAAQAAQNVIKAKANAVQLERIKTQEKVTWNEAKPVYEERTRLIGEKFNQLIISSQSDDIITTEEAQEIRKMYQAELAYMPKPAGVSDEDWKSFSDTSLASVRTVIESTIGLGEKFGIKQDQARQLQQIMTKAISKGLLPPSVQYALAQVEGSDFGQMITILDTLKEDPTYMDNIKLFQTGTLDQLMNLVTDFEDKTPETFFASPTGVAGATKDLSMEEYKASSPSSKVDQLNASFASIGTGEGSAATNAVYIDDLLEKVSLLEGSALQPEQLGKFFGQKFFTALSGIEAKNPEIALALMTKAVDVTATQVSNAYAALSSEASQFGLVISNGTITTDSTNTRAKMAQQYVDKYFDGSWTKARAAKGIPKDTVSVYGEFENYNIVANRFTLTEQRMGKIAALEKQFSSLEARLPTTPSREKKTKTSSSNIGEDLGIDFAAYEAEAGLPSGYLERTAFIESRGDVNAVSPTGATGLFQFTKGTAKDMGLTDRNDPVASTEATVRLALRNQKGLERVLGRKPTGAELYLAHQQGLGGASALLRDTNANVVEALLPAYKGNRERAEQAVKVNGGKITMTAGEFANIWLTKHGGGSGLDGGRPTTMAEATGQIQPKPSATTVSMAPASAAATAPVREGSQPAAEVATPTPTEEPTQQARATSAAPAVSQEGQALLANIGAEVDKTYRTAEEFQAATVAGELEAGDIISVNGELYFIRKDGTPQKVGG